MMTLLKVRWTSARSILALTILAVASAGVAAPPSQHDLEVPPLETLRERAEAGDADAQFELALRYRDGRGVARDPRASLHWSRRAADQGHGAALDNVGFHYFQGLGVGQDFDVAFGYFKSAAARGSAWGWYNLGRCHFGALGTTQDFGRAIDAWRRGADAGHGLSATYVAIAYASGEGVAADPAEATRWARRAAELGDVPGLTLLGELLFQSGKTDDARRAWESAAARGSTQASDLLRLIDLRRRAREPGEHAFVSSVHVHQGHNNCGATACTMLARFQGATVTQYDVKRHCSTPFATGSDWAELVAAGGKLGLGWALKTFAADDKGFEKGAAFLRAELDAGRPVVIDFTVDAPDLPGGTAGHTVTVAGYFTDSAKQEDDDNHHGWTYVIRDPAHVSPGLRLLTERELDAAWRSGGYSAAAKGVVSRPAIAIEAR